MKFEFKITTWERVEVPEEKEQEILQLIKEGKITSSNEIFDHCPEASFEIIPEVEEQMTPEENGDEATIEVSEGNEFLFDNGIN
jgi:hypothetical protein